MATTPRNRSLRTARPSATSTSDGSAHVPPGPKPSVGATIYSVADRAGVSIATVSRVLQGSTVVSEAARQKVLDAVDALHYVPLGAARSLAVRHHEAYGLVLPELTGPYYSELLMGFETRAAELGQSVVLLLANGKSDLPRAVGHLATRVDGIGVLGSAAMPPAVARALRGRKPVVVIAGAPADGVDSLRRCRPRRRGERPQCRAPDRAPASTTAARRLLFVGDRRGPRRPRSPRRLRRRAHGSWARAPRPFESPSASAKGPRWPTGCSPASCRRMPSCARTTSSPCRS